MLTRRHFGFGVGANLALGACARRVRAAEAWPEGLRRRFAEIEAQIGGRLGAWVLDTQTGRSLGHRAEERFPMCSTHKALSAAAILARVDRGEERLDRHVRFTPDEVLPYSPGTKQHAGGEGMTLAAICEAAVTLSDNTAANLMLNALGGPAGWTAYLRGLGDNVTRLDRTEPTLNEATPGDPRDTTSPLAMGATLNRLVLGDALKPASRELLTRWLVDCKTGDTCLRAGVPQGWRVGDKTGAGRHGTAGDIGMLWPPNRKPTVVTVYITGTDATADARSEAIAAVARTVVQGLGI